MINSLCRLLCCLPLAQRGGIRRHGLLFVFPRKHLPDKSFISLRDDVSFYIFQITPVTDVIPLPIYQVMGGGFIPAILTRAISLTHYMPITVCLYECHTRLHLLFLRLSMSFCISSSALSFVVWIEYRRRGSEKSSILSVQNNQSLRRRT